MIVKSYIFLRFQSSNMSEPPQQLQILCYPQFPENRKQELINLLYSLFGTSRDKISEVLSHFEKNDWLEFLIFLHFVYLHDVDLQFSDLPWDCFYDILMVCPVNMLTEFISSLVDQCRINLLERNNDIWIKYFTRLIETGERELVLKVFSQIREAFPDYEIELVFFLERELWNPELNHELRDDIFIMISSTFMILIVVQIELEIDREPTISEENDWIMHVAEENGFDVDFVWNSRIDPSAFVETTFPQIDSNPESVCVICLSANDNETNRVFRKFPCCNQQGCHECLVELASFCNKLDPLQPLKKTDMFKCPTCRHKTDFF